jgi:hypothetical protein
MTLDRRTLLKHAAGIGALSLSTPALAESSTAMPHVFSAGEADRQLPQRDEIFLDHVGHFVRDPDAASQALSRAGFAPTPKSIQVNPDPAGGPAKLTGTGNVTAMLARGYLEFLFKTADTPLGQELDAALARYPGVHLAACSVADAEAAHARLAASGFAVRPLVRMQRPVDTENGPGIAAFTVARVAPDAMAEGRIQILTHRTEDTVWQKRWLTHPNGAMALIDVAFIVADPTEAATRFQRFTGRPATASKFGQSVALDRGRIQLMRAEAARELWPEGSVPSLPFALGYGIAVASLARAQDALQRGGIESRRMGDVLAAPFPEALGQGSWFFVEQAAALPWRG